MANLEDYGRVDLSTTETWSGDNEPIPAGTYHVAVVGADIKRSRKDNNYLSVEFSVVEGEYLRRRVWENYAIWAESDVPRQRFKGLRFALGLNPNVGGSTEELVNRECLISVKVKDRADGDGKENRVSGYKPLGSSGSAPASAQGVSKARASAKPRPAPAPKPAPAPESAPSEDESPFPWMSRNEA